MADANDLSGKVIKFTVNSTPVEIKITQGKVSDVCDQSHYLPVGQNIKNTVSHGRLITYTFQGALLTDALPQNTILPGTEIQSVSVTLDRGAMSAQTHASAFAEVQSLEHTFDTTTHQIWDGVLVADGDYTPPS